MSGSIHDSFLVNVAGSKGVEAFLTVSELGACVASRVETASCVGNLFNRVIEALFNKLSTFQLACVGICSKEAPQKSIEVACRTLGMECSIDDVEEKIIEHFNQRKVSKEKIMSFDNEETMALLPNFIAKLRAGDHESVLATQLEADLSRYTSGEVEIESIALDVHARAMSAITGMPFERARDMVESVGAPFNLPYLAQILPANIIQLMENDRNFTEVFFESHGSEEAFLLCQNEAYVNEFIRRYNEVDKNVIFEMAEDGFTCSPLNRFKNSWNAIGPMVHALAITDSATDEAKIAKANKAFYLGLTELTEYQEAMKDGLAGGREKFQPKHICRTNVGLVFDLNKPYVNDSLIPALEAGGLGFDDIGSMDRNVLRYIRDNALFDIFKADLSEEHRADLSTLTIEDVIAYTTPSTG